MQYSCLQHCLQFLLLQLRQPLGVSKGALSCVSSGKCYLVLFSNVSIAISLFVHKIFFLSFALR